MIRQQPCIDKSSDPSELYTKVLFQSTRDQVTKQPRQRLVNALSLSLRSLSPSGVKSRLQANLLYLFSPPSLYLHSLPFFVCLLESLDPARLLNAERSASTKRVLQCSLAVLWVTGAQADLHALSKSHITSEGQMVELKNKHNKVYRKLPASQQPSWLQALFEIKQLIYEATQNSIFCWSMFHCPDQPTIVN